MTYILNKPNYEPEYLNWCPKCNWRSLRHSSTNFGMKCMHCDYASYKDDFKYLAIQSAEEGR